MVATMRSLAVMSLAVAFAMGAVYVANAQTSDSSLEDRVEALENLVEDLQKDLDDANKKIAALEEKVGDLSSSDDDDSDDDSKNKGKKQRIEGDDTGNIKLCHKGMTDKDTIEVGIGWMKAHLDHGDTVGECGEHEYHWGKFDDDDSGEDEDEDDDDDGDDD